MITDISTVRGLFPCTVSLIGWSFAARLSKRWWPFLFRHEEAGGAAGRPAVTCTRLFARHVATIQRVKGWSIVAHSHASAPQRDLSLSLSLSDSDSARRCKDKAKHMHVKQKLQEGARGVTFLYKASQRGNTSPLQL